MSMKPALVQKTDVVVGDASSVVGFMTGVTISRPESAFVELFSGLFD